MNLIPLLALSLPLVAPQKSDSLDGTWTVTAMEMAGSVAPPQVYKDMVLVLKGDTYDLFDGHGHDRGKSVANPKKNPKTLDITGKEGPNKGKTILAIYKLEKGQLTVCYGMTGTRPTKFETKDTQFAMVTYRRKSK